MEGEAGLREACNDHCALGSHEIVSEFPSHAGYAARQHPPPPWCDVEVNNVVNLGDIQFLVKAFEVTIYTNLAGLEFIGWDPADYP